MKRSIHGPSPSRPGFTSAVFILILLIIAFVPVRCTRNLVDQNIRLGIWASENDLWDEAIFRWKQALSLNPNSAAAHNNLAVAYEKKGLREEAKKEYEIALKLAPANNYVKNNYNSYLQSADLSKSEQVEKK